MTPIVWQILLQIILIALNAVFACAEIAVISVSDAKLAQLISQGDKRAMRLARLTSQPARFLATIQVAITLSGFLGSAFAADNFAGILVDGLLRLGVPVPAQTLNAVSVVLITLILSYFTLVFGELVPKRLAMKKAEGLALAMSGMISALARVASPIVWVLTASTNLVLRLCGLDPNAEEDEVSEEEIRMMVDAGSKKGVIDQEEREFIQNVFEFDDRTVAEFATHRTELTVLWQEDSDEVWDTTIRENRFAKYPVCGETADDVIGVLNVRDYFRLQNRNRALVMEKAVRPAYFVPQHLRADVLFRDMKRTRNHFAVVLDEYGGVTGVVTMNDLLEQLVGDLEDDLEKAAQPQEIEPLAPGRWRIQGSAPLKEVARNLSLNFTEEVLDTYDTFGGFVFGQLGTVPEDQAHFSAKLPPVTIHTARVREHRLEDAVVSPLTQPEPAGTAEHPEAHESSQLF